MFFIIFACILSNNLNKVNNKLNINFLNFTLNIWIALYDSIVSCIVKSWQHFKGWTLHVLALELHLSPHAKFVQLLK